MWKSLKHLPRGFTLEPNTDARGHFNLSNMKGKGSFVRKIDGHGTVEINSV